MNCWGSGFWASRNSFQSAALAGDVVYDAAAVASVAMTELPSESNPLSSCSSFPCIHYYSSTATIIIKRDRPPGSTSAGRKRDGVFALSASAGCRSESCLVTRQPLYDHTGCDLPPFRQRSQKRVLHDTGVAKVVVRKNG